MPPCAARAYCSWTPASLTVYVCVRGQLSNIDEVGGGGRDWDEGLLYQQGGGVVGVGGVYEFGGKGCMPDGTGWCSGVEWGGVTIGG